MRKSVIGGAAAVLVAAAVSTGLLVGDSGPKTITQPAVVGKVATIHLDQVAQPTVTVGQTLSQSDLQIPVVHPADAAAPPTDWNSRVQFKGCGQNVTVRSGANKRILLFNSGSVPRYVRSTGGIQIPVNDSTLLAPRDWRVVTFSQPGVYTITFTTATCTLWAPKIVVTIK